MGLPVFFTLVEDTGVWPEGVLDAYIAMIPKTDGDATHLGQRTLSVLPVVCRVWASARMGQPEGWFRSWVPDSVFSAGVVVGRWRLGILLHLILRRVLSGVVDSDVHFFVADVFHPLILLIGGFLILF